MVHRVASGRAKGKLEEIHREERLADPFRHAAIINPTAASPALVSVVAVRLQPSTTVRSHHALCDPCHHLARMEPANERVVGFEVDVVEVVCARSDTGQDPS